MNKAPSDPFRFHTGQSYSYTPHPEIEKSQWQGKCPFCNKEDHFFFNGTWQWDCKICKKEGNVYTFIRLWHEKCVYTNVDHLAAARGLPLKVFRLAQVKWNPNNSSYIIPTFRDGKINGLYKAIQDPMSGKFQILNMPGVDTTLFNYPSGNNEIILLEGLWDKLAADAICGDTRNVERVGMPGSGFKNTWVSSLQNRRVFILTDNDDGGRAQKDLILKRIEASPQKPMEVFAIDWSSVDVKDGYDVNDAYLEHGTKAYEWLITLCKPVESLSNPLKEVTISADTSCDSFEKLIERCKEAYYFTPDMELLLLLMLSSLYSLRVEGEQLWLRVIGPPGSSKTTLARIVGASEQAILRDTFTGLLSGWKDDDAADASLIPMISGKALVVKEADALLRQPNYDQIMSQLRAFYDKDIAATYLNRVNIDYKNIRSSFMLCGTHMLRGIDNVALGDRFLDYEFHVSEDDKEHIADKMLERSIEAGISGNSSENRVWEAAKGFIDHHMSTVEGVATVGPEEKKRILQYSKLIAFMRAKVQRDRGGELLYKPYAEVPSRLIGQFTKLFQCAPRVLGIDYANTLVHKLVSRVVADIIDRESNRYRICEVLVVSPGRTRDQIQEMTDLPMHQVTKELDDMKELKLIETKVLRTSSNTGINVIELHTPIAERFSLIMEHMHETRRLS